MLRFPFLFGLLFQVADVTHATLQPNSTNSAFLQVTAPAAAEKERCRRLAREIFEQCHANPYTQLFKAPPGKAAGQGLAGTTQKLRTELCPALMAADTPSGVGKKSRRTDKNRVWQLEKNEEFQFAFAAVLAGTPADQNKGLLVGGSAEGPRFPTFPPESKFFGNAGGAGEGGFPRAAVYGALGFRRCLQKRSEFYSHVNGSNSNCQAVLFPGSEHRTKNEEHDHAWQHVMLPEWWPLIMDQCQGGGQADGAGMIADRLLERHRRYLKLAKYLDALTGGEDGGARAGFFTALAAEEDEDGSEGEESEGEELLNVVDTEADEERAERERLLESFKNEITELLESQNELMGEEIATGEEANGGRAAQLQGELEAFEAASGGGIGRQSQAQLRALRSRLRNFADENEARKRERDDFSKKFAAQVEQAHKERHEAAKRHTEQLKKAVHVSRAGKKSTITAEFGKYITDLAGTPGEGVAIAENQIWLVFEKQKNELSMQLAKKGVAHAACKKTKKEKKPRKGCDAMLQLLLEADPSQLSREGPGGAMLRQVLMAQLHVYEGLANGKDLCVPRSLERQRIELDKAKKYTGDEHMKEKAQIASELRFEVITKLERDLLPLIDQASRNVQDMTDEDVMAYYSTRNAELARKKGYGELGMADGMYDIFDPVLLRTQVFEVQTQSRELQDRLNTAISAYMAVLRKVEGGNFPPRV